MQVEDAAIIKALAEFKGVGRRFQRYGEVALPAGGRLTLIDDWPPRWKWPRPLPPRHGAPFPGRRLVLAFQPHRYSRTRDCFGTSSRVLSTVDTLLLADVYAAGGAPSSPPTAAA